MKKINWADEVNRSTLKILHSGLRELNNPEISKDILIHNSRKRVKNIRAILKLIEDNIGSKTFKDLNTSLRNLNRNSANVRRAYVMIGIIDKEIKAISDGRTIKLLESLKSDIEQNLISAQPKININQILTAYFDYFHSFEKKVEAWKFNRKDFTLIKIGLARIYDQGKQFSKQIKKNHDVLLFHEMRKNCKDLSYALDIIQKAWPVVLKSYNDQIKLLTDYIGDMHDLYEFKLMLNKNLSMNNSKGQRPILLNKIDERINSFMPITLKLAEKIFAERTESFMYRMGKIAEYKLNNLDTANLP